MSCHHGPLLPMSSNAILSPDELRQFQEVLKDPTLWNEYTHRTRNTESPHHGLSDIWVRYAPFSEIAEGKHDPWNPFKRVYYPVSERLQPYLGKVVNNVFRFVFGQELGVILITKIPPGVQCKPHVDDGWAPNYFTKYAFQIQSNEDQKFNVKWNRGVTQELVTKPGDLFFFDNSRLHYVNNDSDEDRITLIMTIKTSRGIHEP